MRTGKAEKSKATASGPRESKSQINFRLDKTTEGRAREAAGYLHMSLQELVEDLLDQYLFDVFERDQGGGCEAVVEYEKRSSKRKQHRIVRQWSEASSIGEDQPATAEHDRFD
jgi:hypothetical protein